MPKFRQNVCIFFMFRFDFEYIRIYIFNHYSELFEKLKSEDRLCNTKNLVHLSRMKRKNSIFLIEKVFFLYSSMRDYHIHLRMTELDLIFFFFVFSFNYRSTIKMIRIGHVSWLSQHWKMCKQFDVPNSIQMDVSIQLAQIPKHSGYVNIHRSLKSGKQCAVHLRRAHEQFKRMQKNSNKTLKRKERETTATVNEQHHHHQNK